MKIVSELGLKQLASNVEHSNQPRMALQKFQENTMFTAANMSTERSEEKVKKARIQHFYMYLQDNGRNVGCVKQHYSQSESTLASEHL